MLGKVLRLAYCILIDKPPKTSSRFLEVFCLLQMSHKIITTVASHLAELCKDYPVGLRLLLAVSGGSDSVALLHIVHSLKNKFKFDLSVVTVNHNIRDEAVSRADAEFVSNLCSFSFAEKIPCIIVEISKKEMQATLKRRDKGLEDAARFLRRIAYERVAKVVDATYVLTAHTKDDFFEGVLMSFFSGAHIRTLLGMKVKNGCYIKPLLNLTKQELRQYLLKKGCTWREDASNSSLKYLRNKVRLSLIPHINEVFPGWKSGVQKTLDKLDLDEQYLASSYETCLKKIKGWNRSGDGISMDVNAFFSLPHAFALRFLQEGFILLGLEKRVSYESISSFMDLSFAHPKVRRGGLLFYVKEEKVVLEKEMSFSRNTRIPKTSNQKSLLHKAMLHICMLQNNKDNVQHGYLIWIDKKEVELSFSNHTLKVRSINEKEASIFLDEKDILTLHLPFCIRSRMIGDVISVGGKKKTLKRLFSKMQVSSKISTIVPIVERGGVVKAVFAGIIGEKNLIGD